MFLKRKANDDDGSGDSKRLALTSPTSTPVKADKTDLKQVDTIEPNTSDTAKEHQFTTSPAPQKPIVDINTIIQKKISMGAYALHENIGHPWFRALQAEFDKPYFKKLSEFVREQRKSFVVFPPENKVYSWTHHHDIKSTRVVILGQDPYHGPGQAHGLSFSVQKGVRIPPSLINIFKELESDIPGFKVPHHGDLIGWAKQGVLMLNTCLTVNQGKPNSHQGKGWEIFTDAVISYISRNLRHNVVFLLWGRPAQRKTSLIDKRHKILQSAHPSPLSAHNGFFGCGHFSKTNAFLREQKLVEIDWKAL